MSGIKGIDELALRLAVALAKQQPRCDNTFDQLPQVPSSVGTDIIALWRNGTTYGCPVDGLPSGSSGGSDFFNVKNFNAKGDGVTDDTTAIQSAITAAAVSGGIVFFPPGNYLVSASLSITASGVSFFGSGPGASKIISSSASAAAAPTVLSFASGVGSCYVDGLGFIGNSIAPSGPPPNAPTVIVFTNGTKVGVYNCYFTSNLGDCIDFVGCADGEVASCRFNGTGYNGAGFTAQLRTPAVKSDAASSAIRVHHNYFTACQFLAIQHLGTDCEASYNYIAGTGQCGIRLHDGTSSRMSGARVIGNEINTSFKVSSGPDSGGGTGIYADNCDNCIIMGNKINNCGADGVSWAACNNTIVANNISYNNCQSAGDCGFQFNPQSGNTGGNVGNVISGNISFDSQGTPTQQNGLRVLGPGSGGAFDTVIVGNSFHGFSGTVGGQPQNAIAMTDSILDDDSNVIRSNACGAMWQDYDHLGAAVSFTGPVTDQTFFTSTIQAGEFGLQRGFRFVASGITSIASGSPTFSTFLTYGSSLGNIFTDSGRSMVNGVGWLLEAWIFTSGAPNNQHFMVRFSYNGALVSVTVGNLTVDTTVDQPFVLQTSMAANGSNNCVTADLERV